MPKTKEQIAEGVVGAMLSLNALKDKIAVLTDYANKLIDSNNSHITLSMEELDVAHPSIIKPVFEPLPMNVDPENLPEGYTPKEIGYMKVYPSGLPDVPEYQVIIPKDIIMRTVDHLLLQMKAEIQRYQKVIDTSIKVPKTETYNYTLAEEPKDKPPG
jgi:hypothetical protein